MLLGIDEYPFHQITQPFAAAGDERCPVERRALRLRHRRRGQGVLRRHAAALPRTTTCSTGSCASATKIGSTTSGCRVGSARRSDSSASGRYGWRSSSRSKSSGWSWSQRLRHRAGRDLPDHHAALSGSGRNHARGRPPCERTGDLRGDRPMLRAGWAWTASGSSSTLVETPSSATTPGGFTRAAAARACTRRPGRGVAPPACGSGCCSAWNHGGFFFEDPSGRSAAGKGAIIYRDRSVPCGRSSTISTSTTVAAGCVAGGSV